VLLRGDRSHGARLRLRPLQQEIVDLRPEMRIALALHVAWGEGPVKPGSSLALNRSLPIVETVIAENLSLGLVSSGNMRAAMDDAMRLVEVRGSDDIFGDDAVVLPRLRHAVHLHRQEHGNPFAVQIASQQNCSGRAPAVPKEDDAGLGFFLVA